MLDHACLEPRRLDQDRLPTLVLGADADVDRPFDVDEHPGQAEAALLERLALVARPLEDRVDERGEAILVEASGLEARVIQHEMDHLDGVLILDRTSRDQRKQAMRALREANAPAAA